MQFRLNLSQVSWYSFHPSTSPLPFPQWGTICIYWQRWEEHLGEIWMPFGQFENFDSSLNSLTFPSEGEKNWISQMEQSYRKTDPGFRIGGTKHTTWHVYGSPGPILKRVATEFPIAMVAQFRPKKYRTPNTPLIMLRLEWNSVCTIYWTPALTYFKINPEIHWEVGEMII